MTERHSKGGKARAESLTPERRKEIAKAAAKERWDKHRANPSEASRKLWRHRPGMARVIEEILGRIEELQVHTKNLNAALRHVNLRNHNRGSGAMESALRNELYRLELEEWRNLFMWGMVVDEAARDRIKAAAYERFLGDRIAVTHWLEPSGISPGMWYSADEEAFRDMAREAFAPRTVAVEDEDSNDDVED